ncbi:MAG: hypothetical protein LBI32_05750 [Myroides odoratus]|jgi:tRNA-binding EMAP/Myf-like protein|nr:hypothetical protein [Myroides odoratus]
MKIFFYIPNKALNEATIYYTEIVERAFVANGIEVVRTQDLKFDFNKQEDYIFTIRVIDYLKASIRFFSHRIIIWFQGILAEEYGMLHHYNFKSKLVGFVFNACEKYVLKKAFFSFFVSKAMIAYFEEKHQITLNANHLVMPCYNKRLNKELFLRKKKPFSFVYAGTLFSWQCFEDTVVLYKEIEQLNPQAKFYIYTREQEEALKILQQYEVQHYELLFVPLAQLDQELSQYEYGFLIREDHCINKVSTPTKMNSYLAVGLIPIYTNVIEDFEQNIDLKEYTFKFDFAFSKKEIAKRVVAQGPLDYNTYLNICESNFKGYYDDVYNEQLITNILVKKILDERISGK